MSPAPLQIKMLGEFTLQSDTVCVNATANRSKSLWLLLSYMIYHRARPIAMQEYVDLLWPEEGRVSNPINALKTMFYRVRSSLDPLWPGAGHQLILRQGTSYVWNPDAPVVLDVEEFDRLCREAQRETDPDRRLEELLSALRLYEGEFLSRLSSALWVLPLAAYYRRVYIQSVLDVLPMLEERGRWQESHDLSRAAIVQEPYMEELYRHLLRALVHLGRQAEAVSVYEEMSELLLSNFGVMPSDETRALYWEAVNSVNDRAVSAERVLEQLKEPNDPGGALVCNYDIFRSIYHAIARSVSRSGDAVHLALISILPQDKTVPLPQRSLDRVVDHLQEIIRASLRRGDVLARCSVSQFVLMLPQANYENSCMICRRIVRAFNRQYPHSPAALRTSVHPLQPN